MKKFGIVGSREGISREMVWEFLNKYFKDSKYESPFFVSGGAKGVDTFADEWICRKGGAILVFYPNYIKYGNKRAPLERNKLIVAESDVLLVLWNGKSTGTMNSLNLGKKRGIPIVLQDFSKLSQPSKV